MKDFAYYTNEIKKLDDRMMEYYSAANDIQKEMNELEEARKLVCPHEDTDIHYHYDDGDWGMERVFPSQWMTEDCNDCGAIIALKGTRIDDEWRDVPPGSSHAPGGVAFPDGFIRSH
jgi:hypothetical protein